MNQKKTTLVILPGWGGTRETWQSFIEIASNDYTVTCLNLPCFGDEPCPPTVWGIQEYSDFVKEKIQSLTQTSPAVTEKVILLGHSFGGQVATYVAAHHPELVKKLILSGPAIFRPNKSFHRLVFGGIAKIGKTIFSIPFLEKRSLMAKKLLYRAAHSPDYQATGGIKREIFKKIIREDVSALLPTIHLPTLVLWGKLDAYTPIKYGQKITTLMPDASLCLYPFGKHGLHLQMPEAMFVDVKKFIES